MPTTLGRLELPCRKEQQSAPLPIGSSTSAEATATSTATQLPPLLTPFTPPASHDQSVSPRVSPDRAFILFRQHLQVSVAAQHPGLSNPEISKIIGNQWRSMPSEAKQQWKNLAEEEKIRHHLQYPDYRYQPRRYGKNSGLDAVQLETGQRERERAAIQTIPYLNKIKLLSIIAPPVGADPRQLDAIHVPRLARARGGALIAIEGESPEAVQLVTNHLSLALSRHDKNVSRLVRTFHGPQIHPASGREGSEGSSHEDASLQYLDIVSAWRKISAEMVDFITDAAKKTGGPRLSLDFPSSSSTSALGHDQARMPSIQEIMGPGAAAPSPHLPRAAAPFRIALVPCYQLTNAEKFACTTPMSDSYSPQDHWQWMASLWRYCAGPDLTVYVRDCGLGEFHESNSFENPVEVRLERYRSLIVRRAVPSSATAAAAGVEEKALRRTVLEVEEYLAQ
ncbi:hypothetical protein KEM52_005551 [Ascosphaera acerosa]|nr:hypothetical protein KEM52_005551 [Ascosphaera acerosa]